MNNTEKYLDNIFNRIYDYAENSEVEINDYDENIDTSKNTITVGIKTLTECSDPEINYYYSGIPEIEDFVDDLKTLLQTSKITFKEDVDVNYDEYDMWISRHGWLKITI